MAFLVGVAIVVRRSMGIETSPAFMLLSLVVQLMWVFDKLLKQLLQSFASPKKKSCGWWYNGGRKPETLAW